MVQARLISADLLRIFSAFIVALFHLAFWSGQKDTTPGSIIKGLAAYPELAPFSSFGFMGVNLFFVLSGFVIVHTASESTALRFAIQRFLRLWPCILICATITLLAAIAIEWAALTDLLGRYQNSVLLTAQGPWVDGTYWTLPAEIGFYLIVLGVLIAGLRRHLEAVMGILGVLFALGWLAGSVHQGHAANLISEAWFPGYLRQYSSYAANFAAGVTIYYGATKGWTAIRVMQMALYLPATMLGMILSKGAYSTAAPYLWLATTIIFIIAVHQEEMIAARLGTWSQSITLVSLATYPFYLLHNFVGAAILHQLMLVSANRFAALIAAIAICAIAALIITRYPERWLKWLMTWPFMAGGFRQPSPVETRTPISTNTAPSSA